MNRSDLVRIHVSRVKAVFVYVVPSVAVQVSKRLPYPGALPTFALLHSHLKMKFLLHHRLSCKGH